MVDPYRGQEKKKEEKKKEKKHSEKNNKNNPQININKVISDVALLLSGEFESV
jgi:hypothetical protein